MVAHGEHGEDQEQGNEIKEEDQRIVSQNCLSLDKLRVNGSGWLRPFLELFIPP